MTIRFTRILALLMCTSMLMLSSCSGRKIKTEEVDYPVPVFDISASEDGILYKDQLLYYFDYENKTAIPFCAQPNCMHDTEDCPALNHYDAYLIVDKKLYAFEPTSNKQIDEDTWHEQANLIMADIGGTNKKVLATFDGNLMFTGAPPRDSNIYYYKNSIYFVTSSLEIKEGISTNYSIWYAYCYDIHKNTLTKLGELCSGYNSLVWVQGMIEDKLYYYAHFSDKDVDYKDYINEDDFFAELDKYLKEENSYLDLLTGEIHDSDLPNVTYESRIFAGYYFYNNDKNEFIARRLKDNIEIKVFGKPCSYYYWAGDRLMFFIDEPSAEKSDFEWESSIYYWIPNTNKIEQIPNRTDGIIFSPFIMKDEYFYGIATYPEEQGIPYLSYAKIEDLTEKDYEITKVE